MSARVESGFPLYYLREPHGHAYLGGEWVVVLGMNSINVIGFFFFFLQYLQLSGGEGRGMLRPLPTSALLQCRVSTAGLAAWGYRQGASQVN